MEYTYKKLHCPLILFLRGECVNGPKNVTKFENIYIIILCILSFFLLFKGNILHNLHFILVYRDYILEKGASLHTQRKRQRHRGTGSAVQSFTFRALKSLIT
jgi:hypothetical protein